MSVRSWILKAERHGRDVVPFGADGEDRRADVGQRDRPALDLEAALGEIVVEKKLSQVLRVHADRACGWRRRSRP